MSDTAMLQLTYLGGAALSALLAFGLALVEVHRAAGFLGMRRGHPWTLYLAGFESLVSIASYLTTASVARAVGIRHVASLLITAIASAAAGAATSRIPLKRASHGHLRSLRDHALDSIQCRAARHTSDWLEQEVLPALKVTSDEEILRRGVAFLQVRVRHSRAPRKAVDLYRKSLRDARVSEDERLLAAMELLLKYGGRDVVDGFRVRLAVADSSHLLRRFLSGIVTRLPW